MPVEATPLFRPDALRPYLRAYQLPPEAADWRGRLQAWVDLFSTPAGMERKETELLPDFLSDVFYGVLGYTATVAQTRDNRYTLSREALVEVDGKVADAVLGEFTPSERRFVVAVEGKGPKDPLERPYAGRNLSAVHQGYQYAINLPCDWIIVTNMRETRLYYKGATQRHFERFETVRLATDLKELRRFVFLLGAARVVPRTGPCHLYELQEASERTGEAVTQAFYTEYAKMRRELLAALKEDNPGLAPDAVLSATQKLLDRVLFIAFSEDRGLLPEDTLERAYRHTDPYNPRPIWSNFQGLFRAIDRGNDVLQIPGYNGGLFAEDTVLDGLAVRDDVCRYFKRLGEYTYRSPTDLLAGDDDDELEGHVIDVEILGHIFEQSITDLEKLQTGKELRSTKDSPTKRKRQGAFYTPAFITRHLTREALSPVLRQRFESLRTKQLSEAQVRGGTAAHVLQDPSVYDINAVNNPQRQALLTFWEAWLDELQTVRVVDPACGSGAS